MNQGMQNWKSATTAKLRTPISLCARVTFLTKSPATLSVPACSGPRRLKTILICSYGVLGIAKLRGCMKSTLNYNRPRAPLKHMSCESHCVRVHSSAMTQSYLNKCLRYYGNCATGLATVSRDQAHYITVLSEHRKKQQML